MKKPSRKKLVKDLDQIFSKWVRLRAVDEYGLGECFTCGKRKSWKGVDAGHFQSRGKYSIRWDEKNVQFQCKGCNMTNGGQQFIFGKKLDEKYGPGTADELVVEGHKTRKFANFELEDMIQMYKDRVGELLE